MRGRRSTGAVSESVCPVAGQDKASLSQAAWLPRAGPD